MKIKSIILFLLIPLLGLISCEEYLDVPRETDEIVEEDIFTSYIETKTYLKQLYASIHNFAYSPGQNHIHNQHWLMYPMAASDEIISPGTSDGSPLMQEEVWYDVDWWTTRLGSRTMNHNFWPFWTSFWDAIRVACVVIDKASNIEDASDEQIDAIKGQAFYGRAFTYTYLLMMHGGMPYFKKALGAEDDFNFVRLSYHETVENIVSNLDSAATYLPADWKIAGSDPYATQDYGRYTSAAAKGLKGRVLLWDASPLSYFADANMGYEVTDNQQERWENAAIACWEAIEFVEANGYGLIPGDSASYKSIFRGEWATKEYLHTLLHNTHTAGHDIRAWTLERMFLPGILVGSSENRNRGVDVPQEMVDRFEAVEYDGSNNIIRALPLDEATSAGFFNEQDPFANRDPRFYYDIIYHGSPKPGYGSGGSDTVWNFSQDSKKDGTFNDDFDKNSIYQDNQSSYYTRKYWMGESDVLYNISEPWPWIVMRVAELYLNYAEAANQAYGPTGSAPGASYSALEAVNVIRNRVGMPDVDPLYTGTKEKLHERIMNERAVELCFEAQHRYIDVRRWRMIETDEYQSSPHVMVITDNVDLVNYPTGYKYEIQPYIVNGILYRRTFHLKHYFMPVSKNDVQKIPTFLQNPGY